MYNIIHGWLEEAGLETYGGLIATILTLLGITIITVLVWFIVKTVVVKIAARLTHRTQISWVAVLYNNKVFHRLGNLSIPLVMALSQDSLPEYRELVSKASGLAAACTLLMLFISLINAIDEIYRQHEVSKTRPIRSFLQVVQVACYVLTGIVAVGILIGENPTVLIGGIGAMTAVTSIIFKDAILGFVAGIQLVSNDMIRIGDWIEVPKASANGFVIDLSMTTVKVRNFDNTITNIPAYTLVSDAFINWRGMQASGGRRIKRAIYIDASCIQLADAPMIERFRKIDLIAAYVDEKLADCARYNETNPVNLDELVNGRRMTNIGTFRAYILAYLKQHSGIHHKMPVMVRQIEPDDRGFPLEIYAFTNTIEWTEYEGIQADIFDHLYAIADAFALKIYQKPSGADLRSLK